MSDKQAEVWYFKRQPKRVITIQLDQRLLITGLLSILLHVAIIYLFAPKLFSVGEPQPDARKTLNITLAPPQKEEIAGVEPALPDVVVPAPALPPTPVKPKPVKPKPKTKPKQQSKPLPVNKTETSPFKVPKATPDEPMAERPETKQTAASTKLAPLPGEDMQAYIQRQQLARLEKQGYAKHDAEAVLENNSPKSGGSSRDARIQKNLDLDGTNGIFQIRYINLHQAEFSFKGWKNNVNTARLEVFQVSAADHQNIRIALIRKMIEVIRRDYSGDFNWVSHRSGETVVLSARQADTANLEAYLMGEFFGAGTQYRRYP